MAQVSSSIHETQRRRCEEPLQGVIFNQYCAMAYTDPFAEEPKSVFGVVEDIDEHDRVKAGVSEWDMPTIKGLHGDPGFVPDEHVHAVNREIWA